MRLTAETSCSQADRQITEKLSALASMLPHSCLKNIACSSDFYVDASLERSRGSPRSFPAASRLAPHERREAILPPLDVDEFDSSSLCLTTHRIFCTRKSRLLVSRRWNLEVL